MARLMLVANPAASQFTGGDHRSIVGSLSRHHMVEAVWPQSAIDARTIAADAVTAGFDGVVAMGGDGIVHQVAQALVGTEVYMAVIPAGTTNVFARQLGLPSRPSRAARYLLGDPSMEARPVVTVAARTTDGNEQTHHAVFAVGVGVDADVVTAAETEPYRKYRFGAVHYARTAIRLLWSDIRRRRPTLRLASGDRTQAAIGVMAQFLPSFTYFGRRPLRFHPDPPDPMSLLVMTHLPVRRLPTLLAAIASGARLDRVKGIEVWEEVDHFTVECDPPAAVELDGEVIGRVDRLTAEFRAESLWVAGPGSDS